MTDRSDLEYFAARARAERELGEASSDPVVAAIHLKMAECYEKLAQEDTKARPILKLRIAS